MERTLSIFEAVSLNNFGGNEAGANNLQTLVGQVHEAFAVIPQRRAVLDGRMIECRSARELNGRTYLHIVAYTVDEQISLVTDETEAADAGLELHDAPDDSEFLDGDLFVGIAGNTVGICRSNLGYSAFTQYVVQKATEHGLAAANVAFNLVRRADADALDRIAEEGVKWIDLNALAFQATMARAARVQERGSFIAQIGAGVWEAASALLGVEVGGGEEAFENAKASVRLQFDNRTGTPLDQRSLSDIARALIENEDDQFAIRTGDNNTIRATDVTLSKKVSLRPFGKSVDRVSAWRELDVYLTELGA